MTELPAWHYDELQHTGADFADPKVVKDYDDRMQRLRDIPREVEFAQNALQLTPDQTLLEIGTGTGEFAIALSVYCREVIALDISPTMLEYAKQKATGRGRSNIRFTQAGFLTYDHSGEPVDAVISQLALHHLSDFWKAIALRHIYAVLKDGGRFLLRDVVFQSNRKEVAGYFDCMIDRIQQVAGEEMALATARHIKNEFSTLDWIMEGLLQRTGFTIQQLNQDGFMTTYLCIK